MLGGSEYVAVTTNIFPIEHGISMGWSTWFPLNYLILGIKLWVTFLSVSFIDLFHLFVKLNRKKVKSMNRHVYFRTTPPQSRHIEALLHINISCFFSNHICSSFHSPMAYFLNFYLEVFKHMPGKSLPLELICYSTLALLPELFSLLQSVFKYNPGKIEQWFLTTWPFSAFLQLFN